MSFSGGVHVFRFKAKWTTLPNADTAIGILGAGPGAWFNPSDNKIYAGTGSGAYGATGVSVTTGVTYYIDVKIDTSANPWLVDAQVNGSACGQKSLATAANTTAQSLFIGADGNTNTSDAIFDDVAWSNTSADYPLGNGVVHHFICTADGTHNIAGTGDFQRTLTGTDILNASTTAFQLIDDVPLETSVGDFINMVAPPNATDYVECVFGPASGIPTPTQGPRGVEVVAAIHQAGTGAGNMEIRLNDNGTTNAVYTASGVAGVTTLAYKRKHYATAPTGGAWTAVPGAGNFNNLRVRFGSPGSVDANPDQFLDCIMIEAEFSANQIVTPGAAVLTLTSFAPQIQTKLTPPSTSLALTTFAPTAKQGKTVTPPNASLTLTKFAPQLRQQLTPGSRSLALTTFAPTARVNRFVTVGAASLTFSTFAPRMVQILTPSSRTMTFSTFAPQLQHKLTPNSRTLILTAFAPLVGLGVMPGSRAVSLTTFAPAVTHSAAVVPGSASLTLATFAPILQTTLTPNAGSLALTLFAPVLAQRITPDARAVSLTTFAPSVQIKTILTPSSATLTLTRLAPVLSLSLTLQSAALSLSRFPPQLRELVTPGSRSLVLSTFAPVLDNSLSVTPQSASLTFTTFAPSVLAPQTVTPQSGVLVLTTFAPQLRAELTPAPATLITTTFAPLIRNTVSPAPRSLLLTTFAPQLQTHITITGGALTLITFAPTVIGHELHALPDDVTLVRRADHALRVRRSSATLTITSD